MTKRVRTEDTAWYQEMIAHRAAMAAKNEARMQKFSPYRATMACQHANVVERTCSYRPSPMIDEEGRVLLGPIVVRLRKFECGDCGVGVWPENDAVRANAAHVPHCDFPLCDCLDDQPPASIRADIASVVQSSRTSNSSELFAGEREGGEA